MDTPSSKICGTCHLQKSLDAFGNDKRTKDGKRWQCKECSHQGWQSYVQRHPEYQDHRHAYYKEYRIKNKERISARMVPYDAKRKAEGKREHQLYPERVKARLKKYYHEHWEEFRDYRDAHKTERNEHGRQYYRKNVQQDRIRQTRRRARYAGLPDTWTSEQEAFMLAYWQHACAVCGNQEGLFWTLANDHWIPLTSPRCPGTVATNMLPLCHGRDGCNNRKKNADAYAFLVRYFGLKQAVKIEKAIAAYFTVVAHTFPPLSLTGD